MNPPDPLDPNSLEFSGQTSPVGANPARLRDFASIVDTLGLLSQTRGREVADAARSQGLSPSQYALAQGLVSAADVDIIHTLLGNNDGIPGYSIVDLLGRGGMGVVYHAIQLSLKRPVALKTILISQLANPVSARRFENEARILASVTHPNIVTAFDFGLHAGRLFLAMELVRGKDIERLIRERGALSEWLVWHVIRQAASGLAHAARVGVVHRDIKPANLILLKPPDGFPIPTGIPLVKIADFGLSILSEDEGRQSLERLTSDSVHVGSPAYMAPEMIESSQAGHAADIFALGITAWHMLVGKLPLAGQPLRQIITKRLSQPTDPVIEHRASVCAETNDLIADMLKLDPEERLHRYDTLLHRIDVLLSGLGESPPTGAENAAAELDSVTDLAAETGLFTDGVFQDIATSEIDPIQAAVPRRPRLPRRYVALGTGLSVVALATVSIVLSVPHAQEPEPLKVSGSRIALFDGRTLSGWQTLGGGWSAAVDDEGGSVLRGTNGTIARDLVSASAGSSPQHFVVEAVVRPDDGAQIEFAIEFARAASGAEHYAIRFRDQMLELGTQAPDAEQLDVLESLPLTSLKNPFAFRLERQVDRWWLMVDGKRVLTAAFLHDSVAPRMVISVKSGTADFSDLTFAILADRTDSL